MVVLYGVDFALSYTREHFGKYGEIHAVADEGGLGETFIGFRKCILPGIMERKQKFLETGKPETFREVRMTYWNSTMQSSRFQREQPTMYVKFSNDFGIAVGYAGESIIYATLFLPANVRRKFLDSGDVRDSCLDLLRKCNPDGIASKCGSHTGFFNPFEKCFMFTF